MTNHIDRQTNSGHAPLRGWDSAPDVQDAKRIIRNMKGALFGSAVHARRHAFDLATSLYDLGVSQGLAETLIFEICKLGDEERERVVRAELERVYEVYRHPPGFKSHVSGNSPEDWARLHVPEEDAWLEADSPWPWPVEYVGKHGAKNAEAFLAERPERIICSNGVLHSFENQVWRELSDDALAAEMRVTDPANFLDTNHIKSMVEAVQHATFTTAKPYEWIQEPLDAPATKDLVLFRNGILDFSSGQLFPNDGSYFATGLPSFDYEPDAACPRWLQTLDECLDRSFHNALQEFAGYILTSDNTLGKILLLIGISRGGKTTVANTLLSLSGPCHSTSRSLDDLGREFGIHGLEDKRVCLIPDAHDASTGSRASALNRIKAISGNDEIPINRKFLSTLSVRLTTRIVITANKPPKFLDESGALAARQLPIIFEKSFLGREDFDLATKLESELSGIANWALQGLKRLRANGGKFSIGAKGRAAIREIAEGQSPALRFATECLEITRDKSDFVSLPDVYTEYDEWAGVENLGRGEKRNRHDFKDDLVAALSARGVTYGRRRWHDPTRPKRKGELRRGFFGVKTKKAPVPE